MLYAHVAIHAPLHQLFTYHIPDILVNTLQVGHLVRVNFGTAMQPAIVVAIDEHTAIADTKPIHEILDPLAVVNTTQIALAYWMTETYLAPIGLALWLWLPPAITGKSTRMAHLIDPTAVGDTPLQTQVLDFLRDHNPCKTAKLEREMGNGFRKALAQLVQRDVVKVVSELSMPRVRPKTVRTVMLNVPIDELQNWRLSAKQRDIVEYLAQFDYPQDVGDVYSNTGATSAQLNTLATKGVLVIGERVVFRDRLADKDFMPAQAPTLTQDQAEVWRVIQPTLHTQNDTHKAFLLHGVTGSGKTEIYLRAIAETIAHGRQAIFLVPEIALTPQTIQRVATRFPNQVAVVHSGLSVGERYDTWQRARSGEFGVIVGTRSALFAPLPNLGLVILDEEHDPSYKQAPPIQAPYYHARSVAEELMAHQNGVVILGSATPDLETRFRAQRGELVYVRLANRIRGHRERITAQAQREHVTSRYLADENDSMTIELPPVNVVDMREELKDGNTSMFSRALQNALQQTLDRHEQAILFLNRRGQATYVFCRDCGYVETCPRCDMPMTYHRQGEALRCHHCGYQMPTATQCPSCGSNRMKYFGAGTQQVEQELHKFFPQANFVRWDADTASNINDHEAILGQFAQHRADVMIGTQMIAKGLDLPLVTLVGVVSADMGLALPDFRADERVFQLLTQVAGRAGRGVLGGQVILQTYQPTHPSIIHASQHDYEAFYHAEINARRELGYPPFRRLARILVQSTHPIEAQRQAEAIATRLQHIITSLELTDTQVIGATPCFFGKIDNHYRWHVLIRSANPAFILRELPHQNGTYIDLDTIDVL
jgi:primosomal protein N' (replication factor Y) (superfamily II helicase)